MSMAWRDTVSHQHLMEFLEEAHDLLVRYLEINHSDVIEGFLDENQYEFTEWIKFELGDDAIER